jgi:nanoRNase/pAp phosphatase (c-di-AMP/oligoRNAs hydrolase)
LDVKVYSYLKTLTDSKHLWLRNNLSTILAQILDTILVLTILCLAGILAWENYYKVATNSIVFKVIAALADKISNTVIDVVIKRHQPDVLFFINSKSEKVCLRQTINKDPVNLGAFAEKICEGGGHNNAAGGIITPIFMEITKNLKPIR